LLVRLTQELTRPLTVIVSPAGFGKTTLLTRWFDSLRSAGSAAVGWLTLDETDSKSSRFVAGLIMAVSRAGIDLEQLESAVAQQNIGTSLGPIIGAMLAAIHSAGRRVIVVLDDYHRANSPAVRPK
jgi:LuxR family maltose regulon positive regulatory protein